MIIGCCTQIEHYDLLANAGYDAITLSGVEISSWDTEAYKRALIKLRQGPLQHISVNGFCPAALRFTGKDANEAKLREYCRRLFERAAELGVRCIGLGAPKSRSVEPGCSVQTAYEQLKEAVAMICNEAEAYGMDVLLESVCGLECNLITTTAEALQVVKQMKLQNLHLVYDIYHEQAEHQPLSVIKEAGDEIRVVHIAQNHGDKRCYLEEAFLDEYRAYWDVLKEIGYDAEFNLEAMHGDPVSGILQSVRVLHQLNSAEAQ